MDVLTALLDRSAVSAVGMLHVTVYIRKFHACTISGGQKMIPLRAIHSRAAVVEQCC